jgi:hypothetical protein
MIVIIRTRLGVWTEWFGFWCGDIVVVVLRLKMRNENLREIIYSYPV